MYEKRRRETDPSSPHSISHTKGEKRCLETKKSPFLASHFSSSSFLLPFVRRGSRRRRNGGSNKKGAPHTLLSPTQVEKTRLLFNYAHTSPTTERGKLCFLEWRKGGEAKKPSSASFAGIISTFFVGVGVRWRSLRPPPQMLIRLSHAS